MFFRSNFFSTKIFSLLLFLVFTLSLIPSFAFANTSIDILGHVRDDDTGDPIANARIDYFYQNESTPFISTYSNQNGRIDTTIFANDTVSRIEISRSGYRWLSVSVPDYNDQIDIGTKYLTEGTSSSENRHRVYGSIVDSRTDEAIVDARVLITDVYEDIRYSGYTNSRGDFDIANVPPGDFEVQVTKYGYETYDRSSLLRVRTGDVNMGSVQLENTGTTDSSSERTLTGRITDEDGYFVQLAEVYLIDQDDTEIKTKTDSRGYYTFSDLDAGTYTIGVNADGYELLERIDYARILSTDDEKVINLVIREESRSGHDVYGRVLDSDRDYIQGVEVSLLDGNTRINRTTTDSRGYYEFRNVPNGRFSIEFKKIGYQTKTLNDEVRVDDSYFAVDQIELRETSGETTVIGGLVGDSQTGLRSVSVYLENANERYTATTNYYGYFTFSEVREGIYDLHAQVNDEKKLLENDLRITGDRVEIGDINVNRLNTGYALRGQITDNFNDPVERVKVEIDSQNLTKETYTDARGNYEIRGLERGSYQITVSKDGYSRKTDEFDITSFDIDKDFVVKPNDYVKVNASSISVAVNESLDVSRFINKAEILSAKDVVLETITSSFEVLIPSEYQEYLSVSSQNQIRGRKAGTAYIEISIRNSSNYDNLSPARIPVTITEAEEGTEAVLTIGSNYYVINGETEISDTTPYISNGRSFFPIRVIATALGVIDDNIKWDNATNTVTLIKGSETVEFIVGESYYKHNGVSLDMDVSPENVTGRVYLPARFVSDALGGEIKWDNYTKSLTIISNL